MAVTTVTSEGKGWLSFPITGGTATSGGGLASIANTAGVSLLILRCIAYFTTNPAAGANLNIGVGTSATHDASDIASSFTADDVDGEYHNMASVQADAKTEIGTPAIWTTSKYINITGDSSTASLAGTLHIEYLRV